MPAEDTTKASVTIQIDTLNQHLDRIKRAIPPALPADIIGISSLPEQEELTNFLDSLNLADYSPEAGALKQLTEEQLVKLEQWALKCGHLGNIGPQQAKTPDIA